jgi:DNA-binding transcriptional MerR regulator
MTDLISETGATRWQIYRWTDEGLLEGPGRGRPYLYPPQTLARIRAIQAIRDRNMTTRDIRDHFYPEPDDDEDLPA